MENLAQIESIKQKIKTASATIITALHKFIFQEEDGGNRQRLKSFQGFTFHEGAQEHIDKLEYARRLTIGDHISCCNILDLEFDGNKEEIIIRICNGLMDLNTLLLILRILKKKTKRKIEKQMKRTQAKTKVYIVYRQIDKHQ